MSKKKKKKKNQAGQRRRALISFKAMRALHCLKIIQDIGGCGSSAVAQDSVL